MNKRAENESIVCLSLHSQLFSKLMVVKNKASHSKVSLINSEILGNEIALYPDTASGG